MKPLAKLSPKNHQNYFQTLEGHSIDSLKILRAYLEKNQEVIMQFCKRWNLDAENFNRNLFITIYLHDIGKLTKQFQDNIMQGKHSQKYPHAFFAFPIFMNLHKIINPILNEIPVEICSVLGHHTQLHKNIYEDVNTEVQYLESAIADFINSMEAIYKELEFNKFFVIYNKIKYFGKLKFLKSALIKNKIKAIMQACSIYSNKIKLKSIYAFFHSILQLCDDYASAEFSDFIEHVYEGDKKIFDSVLSDREKYVLNLPDIPRHQILKENEPYAFQEELYNNANPYCLLLAPCGRGKTEGALLWAMQVCKKYKRNKIVFAMPTQITSNAMRDRFCSSFGEENVGLFHGKSFVKLKEEMKEKIEIDELTQEDLEGVRGENFKGNVFFKPITVTTIDHLIYSFVHGFSQADFALGNLQNAVIVFDEVHYYEKHTLEHLITLFKILKKMQIPHLLMSGTLPEFFINKVRDIGKKINPEYRLLLDEYGLKFEPFKVEVHKEPLITKEAINEEVIEEIICNYQKGLNQFIILNTVARSQKVYKILKQRLELLELEDSPNIILHNSQFTSRDRTIKENKILATQKNQLLVATQVIEISLDISSDLMYSELAPADALGQRGGRLNRGSKYWKNNGMEHKMKVYLTQEFFKEKGIKDLPYSFELLEKTKEYLKTDVYSYFKIKQICDKVYSDYELLYTNLQTIFEKCSLFGFSHQDITFGTEEEGKLLKIREEKFQKIDVIPVSCYANDVKNLRVENQVKIPLWWYYQERDKYGEDLRSFSFAIKYIGKREKHYLICNIPYNSELGFDYEKFEEFVDLEDNII
ncbi:MAG TPA: CRISPR-associated helicase Cas3' [Methanosarcinales archaeon]|nr:CRISPR-associated helicase Cas3' [Methanosarcinales archaeon]